MRWIDWIRQQSAFPNVVAQRLQSVSPRWKGSRYLTHLPYPTHLTHLPHPTYLP